MPLFQWQLRPALLILATTVVLSLSQLAAAANNASLLWGPYRSNLYFGVRPRIPFSISTALMWARVDDYETPQKEFRYTCEQTDNIAGYGWEEYDVRQGGRQTFYDAGSMIDMTIEFAKVPGGTHGGNWGARISGKLRKDAPPNVKTTLVFATTLEGMGSLKLGNPPDPKGYEGDVRLDGHTKNLGAFTLDITKGPDTNAHPFIEHPSAEEKPLDRTFVHSVQGNLDEMWHMKTVVFKTWKAQIDSYLETYGQENIPPPAQLFTVPVTKEISGNVHLVQKVFEGPFEFDILFTDASATEPMISEHLTRALNSNAESYEALYQKLLKAPAPFDSSEYDPFAKSLLSNLLGGIGHFYGHTAVDRSFSSEYDEENEGFWTAAEEARARTRPSADGPHDLFTAVPSRPFFPRGFLWDEGFHLLPMIDWDPELVVEILRSWLNLMDEDGWIAREQILGIEAHSKVPSEFQIQYPHYANPPTFFLVFETLLDQMESKDLKKEVADHLKTSLASFYPLLKRHYFWYRKTQRGDLKSYDRKPFSSKEAYRWKGRTPTHILTSGLDDYPRAQPPHPGELHVDLISWMGMMTRSMKRIAKVLRKDDDVSEFSDYETAIERNIDDLHWNSKENAFCDVTVDEYEESAHACHKGYVSLMPFLTGMLAADSPRLPAVLDLISDPEELWSPHGIRSLSKKDSNYGAGENYWCSPIWINMNYLVVKNLLEVAQTKSSPHHERAAELYTALRHNLVDTVYNSWKETGFAWEQYNPDTGAGQRTKHFTGWTSLVVNIMRMPDLSGGKPRKMPPIPEKAAPSEEKAAPSEEKPAPSEEKPAPSEEKPAPPQEEEAPSQAKAPPAEEKAAPSQAKAPPAHEEL